MYERPRVRRFGTFRELTQAGTWPCSDHSDSDSDVAGISWNSPPSGGCRS